MDWTQLISDLESKGLTQKTIAQKVGCSQPYISQLKVGRRNGPDFNIGQALVELHQFQMPISDQCAASAAAAATAGESSENTQAVAV